MKMITSSLFLLCFCISYSYGQCPNSTQPGIHVVQPNDNLYRISLQYGTSIEQICQWNNIPVNKVLSRCEELIVNSRGATSAIPQEYNSGYNTSNSYDTSPRQNTSYSSSQRQPGNKHTIRSGETIAGLAALYGYTESRFREINAMRAGDPATPGSVIFSSDCSCERMSYNDPGVANFDYTGTNNETTYNGGGSGGGYNGGSGNYGGNNNGGGYNPPSNNEPAPSSTSGSTGGMNREEVSMVDEINLLRSNPSAYGRIVQQYVNEQKTTGGWPISQSVVNELIGELNGLSQLSRLEPRSCLYDAARRHGNDQKPTGDVNHQGRDGLWPWDRVMNACPSMTDGNENLVAGPSKVRESVIILLIDEGIPNRGHRRTLLKPEWKYVACYKIGTVGQFPNYWVQKFGTDGGSGASTGSSTNPSTGGSTGGFGGSTNPAPQPTSNVNPGSATGGMSSVEMSMVNEINLLRSSPSGYVKYVNDYVNEQKSTGGWPISQSVVNELIGELNGLGTLSQLQPAECLYRAAKKHGDNQKPTGDVNHQGLDGLWPWDRVRNECSSMSDGNENLVAGPSKVRESVIMLLIDEGIPNRGHRRTLLKKEWQYVACYKIGTVGQYPNYWVQKFGF